MAGRYFRRMLLLFNVAVYVLISIDADQCQVCQTPLRQSHKVPWRYLLKNTTHTFSGLNFRRMIQVLPKYSFVAGPSIQVSIGHLYHRPWISNYIHHKVWDQSTFPFPNFNSATVEVREWIKISSHTLLGMSLLIHAVIKLIRVNKRSPTGSAHALVLISFVCPLFSIFLWFNHRVFQRLPHWHLDNQMIVQFKCKYRRIFGLSLKR